MEAKNVESDLNKVKQENQESDKIKQKDSEIKKDDTIEAKKSEEKDQTKNETNRLIGKKKSIFDEDDEEENQDIARIKQKDAMKNSEATNSVKNEKKEVKQESPQINKPKQANKLVQDHKINIMPVI